MREWGESGQRSSQRPLAAILFFVVFDPVTFLPHSGARHQTPKTVSKPKSVSVHQRLQEFKGEELKELAVKLFCTICREDVGL